MDKNKAYIAGGVGLAAVLSFGLFYYFRKNKKLQLSPWLEEYVKELEIKVGENKENPSIETILNIFFLSIELEDYIYLQENSDLEQERIDNINNKEIYEHLVFETEELKDKCTKLAIEYIEKRLGVTYYRLQEIVKDTDQAVLTKLVDSSKKPYSELPLLSKEKVRDAFKAYAKLQQNYAYVTQQQYAMMQRAPEYQETAMKILHINRYFLQDFIKKTFGCEPKFLRQLVNEHKLLEEQEIKVLYDQMRG